VAPSIRSQNELTWDSFLATPSQEGKTFTVSELDHRPPAGALGRFLDRLFLAGIQKRNMHRTLENVKRLTEG
jgi:hypothetical protein